MINAMYLGHSGFLIDHPDVTMIFDWSQGRLPEIRTDKPLMEYSWFVEAVREKKKGEKLTLEDAIDKAIDEMPDGFLIKRFILGNRAEVMNMCLTEYNEAETMQRFKGEGREEVRSFTDKELQRQLLQEMEKGNSNI